MIETGQLRAKRSTGNKKHCASDTPSYPYKWKGAVIFQTSEIFITWILTKHQTAVGAAQKHVLRFPLLAVSYIISSSGNRVTLACYIFNNAPSPCTSPDRDAARFPGYTCMFTHHKPQANRARSHAPSLIPLLSLNKLFLPIIPPRADEAPLSGWAQ